MPSSLKCGLLFLMICALPLRATYGQEGDGNKDLPINPDSIYALISPVAEQMIEGRDVPIGLSAPAWQEDLDTLAAAMRRRIPYAETVLGGDAFARRLDSLKREIPDQTQDQRILSLMRLINLPTPGTGHTQVRTSQRAINWRVLPVWPYRFADGVYIMSAADPNLIGSEVLAIGGTPIDSVYTALAPYISSDNRWDRERRTAEWALQLRWTNHLRALGIVDQIDDIPLRIRTKKGKVREVHVKTMKPNSPSYVRFLTSDSTRPSVPPDLQWSPATRRQNSDEPNYQYSYRDSTNLLYVQFNTVENASSDWTTADLADSLRHIADTRPLEKVIVDLRTNNGGSAYLAEPLVELFESHPQIDRRGTLYTLISPITFSAAGMFAMELERRTKTLFVGEPSGFAPNIWGEFAPVQLPNSKITVLLSYAYKLEGMPNTPRTHLAPDLHVPLTSNQHFSNIDSTMIAVRNHEPEPLDTTTLNPTIQKQFTGTYRLSPVHVGQITEAEGELHFRMRKCSEPFIETDLYPLSPTRMATDVSDVFLERKADREGLMLAWKDTTYALTPADSDTQTPIQKIRAGQLKEGTEDLRKALDAGIILGSDCTENPLSDLMEEPLPTWPDSLSKRERAKRALPYQRLAVELALMSWRVHADLAQVYSAFGRRDDALHALQSVRNLYPPRYEDMLELLGFDKKAK